MDSKIYVLRRDLPSIPSGTKFLQHPRYVNRWHPETEFENGELISDKAPLYGFLRAEMDNTHWFLPIEDHEVAKAKELLLDNGYSVINPDGSHTFKLKKGDWSGSKSNPEKKYTVEDLRKAFNAARTNESGSNVLYWTKWVTPKFEDYLKTL